MGRQEWMYALPFVGKYVYQYDRIKDQMQMQKDWQKNTGRKVKYGTNAYSAHAYRDMGGMAEDTLHSAGRTYRKMI